jgi:lysine-specific demethylase 8
MGRTNIVRLKNPTPTQLDRCIADHRPAIFSGLMDGQRATTSWDLPYLRAKLGARAVKVVTHDRPRLYWDPEKGLPLRPRPFEEFARDVFERRMPGYSYLQDDVNSFPDIKDDYRLPSMVEEKGLVRGKFWLSGPGLITPLHYDPVETFHWVVRGTKRFLCYEPGVSQYYPFPSRSTAPFISQVDPDHPQPGKYPRFQRARQLEFQVEPGEILYLPAYWWHQVYSEGAVNVSVNFVWFASRWKTLRHFGQALRARRHVAGALAQARALAQATDRA